MKLKHLLPLLFLANTAVFAQTHKADSLYWAKNYGKAATLYLLAVKQDEFKPSILNDYYQAACCYALNGNADSCVILLKVAIKNGFVDTARMKADADLTSLHTLPVWSEIINSIKSKPTSTHDPYKVKLITTDIKHFWKAYDMAQKDTAHRYDIYKKYYVDAGTDGLQDYFAFKIRHLKYFVAVHDKLPKFYAAIRKNTLLVDEQKTQMIASFVKLKQIYPDANFPDIYFVIGAFTAGGFSTNTGLLIGLDQNARSPDIPLDELGLWARNNFEDIKDVPNVIAHELIHFNQGGMARDTTLLKAALDEGMADFIGDLISGGNIDKRLNIWAKGKEKKIWARFEKEMCFKNTSNWLYNASQETVDNPADQGYWVGYQICKAYYDKSTDKNRAIYEMLNIKNYKEFYEKSGAAGLFIN